MLQALEAPRHGCRFQTAAGRIVDLDRSGLNLTMARMAGMSRAEIGRMARVVDRLRARANAQELARALEECRAQVVTVGGRRNYVLLRQELRRRGVPHDGAFAWLDGRGTWWTLWTTGGRRHV